MRTEDALRRLGEFQARILAEVETSSTLLEAGPETARAELAKARWAMSRLPREYQLFKHVEIFDPAIAGGNAARAEAARSMKANCIAAGEKHAAHVARWAAQDVEARWEEYCTAMRGAAGALRSHVARERRDVERLLAGSESTRRLAVTR